MGAFLQWVVARRLLTLAGFAVILLGAFIPWPNLAIAAVVIIVGALLLAVQIPIAMRDATEQLDGFDEPAEQWQSSSPAAYEPPVQFQPEKYSQPQEPLRPEPALEAAAAWQPTNVTPAAAPLQAPSRVMYDPAPVWQPRNILQPRDPDPTPQQSQAADHPVRNPADQAVQSRGAGLPEQSPAAEQPEPAWKVGEPAPAWRPKNIPQH